MQSVRECESERFRPAAEVDVEGALKQLVHEQRHSKLW